jgi:hypothetical protein
VVAENSFLGKLLFGGFPFFHFLWRYLMKRILLFLLLFCFLGCGIMFAAEPDKPPKLIIAPLFNFEGFFIMLRDKLIDFFMAYCELILGGVIIIVTVVNYFCLVIEEHNKRIGNTKQDIERRRFETQRAEKSRLRERERDYENNRRFVSKYLRDSVAIDRVLHDMEGDNWKDAVTLNRNVDDIGVAPSDPSDLPFDKVSVVDYEDYVNKEGSKERASQEHGSRATTYWRADGEEEGSKRVKHREHFHMDDEEEDYPRLARIEDEDDDDGY